MRNCLPGGYQNTVFIKIIGLSTADRRQVPEGSENRDCVRECERKQGNIRATPDLIFQVGQNFHARTRGRKGGRWWHGVAAMPGTWATLV